MNPNDLEFFVSSAPQQTPENFDYKEWTEKVFSK